MLKVILELQINISSSCLVTKNASLLISRTRWNVPQSLNGVKVDFDSQNWNWSLMHILQLTQGLQFEKSKSNPSS